MILARTLVAVCASLLGLVLTMPLIILGLPLWLVACATRACGRLLAPRTIAWQQVMEFTPTVGWKPKTHLDTYCTFAAGAFHVKTDEHGWRGETNLTDSDVVVFGDSYAFSYGMDDAKAFYAVAPTGLRIKSIGAPGYNMVQELLLMRHLSASLKDKLVVWFIYIGNDLYDNLLPNHGPYRMPFVRHVNGTGKWEIVTRHVKETKWLSTGNNHQRIGKKWSATFATNFLSQRVYDACEFLIEQGKEVCNQAGGYLVIFAIPWVAQLEPGAWQRILSRYGDVQCFDPDLPDKKIGEICAKFDVPFVDGKAYLGVSDHIPNEGHWNERGHRRVGELLQALYDKYVTHRMVTNVELFWRQKNGSLRTEG